MMIRNTLRIYNSACVGEQVAANTLIWAAIKAALDIKKKGVGPYCVDYISAKESGLGMGSFYLNVTEDECDLILAKIKALSDLDGWIYPPIDARLKHYVD